MVDQSRSSTYLGGSEGAPPVPPPGGYRGAQRSRTPQLPPGAPKPPTTGSGRKRWLGIAALAVSAAFVVVLFIVLNKGGSHVLYGFNMLAVQIAVLAVILIALLSPGTRRWGAGALAIALVFNVATVGAVGSINSAATGNYENLKSDEQKFWEKYPGIKGADSSTLLAYPTLEELQKDATETTKKIKDRLTADFGLTWATPLPEMKRPTRNGYGGESWFFTYTTPREMTNESIHGTADKTAIINAIKDVLSTTDYEDLNSMSEAGYRDDAVIEQLYGSTDPTKQAVWEFYSSAYSTPMTLYVKIVDLSNDTPDGRFRADRVTAQSKTGEPLEGLSIEFVTGKTISEADVPAYKKLIKEYE